MNRITIKEIMGITGLSEGTVISMIEELIQEYRNELEKDIQAIFNPPNYSLNYTGLSRFVIHQDNTLEENMKLLNTLIRGNK